MINLRKGMKTILSYMEAKATGQIDELCIPLCDIFNKIGMPTLFCCQGHEEGDEFNIIFESTVSDDEIMYFLKIVHDVEPGVTYGGDFSKWYRYNGDILLINWIYRVFGTMENIRKDVGGAEKLFSKAADYIRDVSSKDPNNVIVYPETDN